MDNRQKGELFGWLGCGRFHRIFSRTDLTVCDLYKSRWQVELFFKWIKQHLRIKAFYGTSGNAVKTQIWIAVSYTRSPIRSAVLPMGVW
jgi:Transposase DDE domain